MLPRYSFNAELPPIRVIVPAYKASSTIQPCLERILFEIRSFPDAEVMVINYKTKMHLPDAEEIHVVMLTQPMNAGEARNLGAAHCGERILVFVDADVLVEPGSIRQLIEPIAGGLCSATVGNYCTHLQKGHFFQNYKKLYINNAYSEPGFIENEFWTALSAIQGEAFWEVGGFSEGFSSKGGEDTEIGIRLTEHAHPIFAVTEACGNHLKEFTFFSLISNDFVKGTRTVELALTQKMALQQNRHAKSNDQAAVLISCLMVAAIAFSSLIPFILLVLPLLTAGYLLTRSNFLEKCYRYHFWFFCRAFCLALLLDVVRACSVANGIGHYLLRKRTGLTLEQPVSHKTVHQTTPGISTLR